jgi:hypothetical protein
MLNGVDYVSWPRLIPLTDEIEYTGRGSTSTKRGRGLPFFQNGKRQPFLHTGYYSIGKKDETDNSAKERLD